MNDVKNFLKYFIGTLVFIAIAYGFTLLIDYLFEQSWGIVGIALLFAVIIGIIGIVKGD
jgi:hypothetical protein